MIRNLKAMLLAALAATALLALSASAAQAHPEFTAPGAGGAGTTTLKVKTDGTGKTAHSVFDITNAAHTESVSFTCEGISGTGSQVGDANTDVTIITPGFHNCTGAGQAVTVTNTGCNFTFTADGELHIVDQAGKLCEHGKDPIDIEFAGCKVEVGRQTIKGVVYHNIAPNVTVSATNLTGIVYNAVGLACNYGTLSNGTYTTGTAIVTGTRPVGTAVTVAWDAA